MKMMNQKKKRQVNQNCHDPSEKNPKKAKKTNQKKQSLSERKAQTKMRLRRTEKNKSRKLRKERGKKKRRREKQSNNNGKSNCWLFKTSIKGLVNIGHQNHRLLLVTMSISPSVWMRVLLTANTKRMCTWLANNPEKVVKLQPLDHHN